MKIIKNLLSVLIIFSLMLSILAGCTSTSEPEEITAASAENVIEVTSDEERIYEHIINYVFVPDDEVIGKWQVFDYVLSIEDFDPDDLKMPDLDFVWQGVSFFEQGTAILHYQNDFTVWEQWTKDYLLMTRVGTVSSYTIKQVNGVYYMLIEWKSGNYAHRGEAPEYYVFKKISSKAEFIIPDDARNFNISLGNLSGRVHYEWGNKIKYLTFNERTIFPPPERMPQNEREQPEYILEVGKNPGLGIRAIHAQGITGKGVNVAIIDEPFIFIPSHPEYKDRIAEYINISQTLNSFHGSLVTSLLAGETMGTAPDVNVFFYSPEWIQPDPDKWELDATAYATALDMVVEKNRTLPDNEKIKLVSISVAPTPLSSGDMTGRPAWINGERYLESVERARQSGILVLDASLENGIIGASGYDFDNPEDVTLCREIDAGWGKKEILAPILYRTSAEVNINGDYSYVYFNYGGVSSAIPWAAGVLALGWEIRPQLTADEIVQILFDTAYVNSDGNKFIYPAAFIEYLQNTN